MSKAQVKTYFDQLASDWSDRYRHRSDYLERERIFRKAITRIIEDSSISAVLEIGCGAQSMYEMPESSGITYYATDISYEMLTRNKAKARFFQADILQFPVNAKFDLVLLSSVIEWLDEPDVVPAILEKLVNPGGVLLVSYPNNKSVLRFIEKNIIRRIKRILRRKHYTDLQVSVKYGRLQDGFERTGLILEDTAYFGKKVIINGRYFSTLRLDTYVKA